ncbi:polyphosphate--glucose phosphotransferase [Robiginitalea sp. SC105]|uniref:polyphosphate--glucose phosphotransferase n=1 Tax=Robiginitalea sp. SC105 TaxID=2762332 RepID=UPI00163AB78A|nr:ROK family protein [Robiginitalea sp. SC105]MBC2839741.1 ROK family protein [Robiginitalea sp. SC105]
MEVLGIDVGGSGIKGAMVHMETGEMLSERYRIPTPKSRKPDAMAKVIAEIVQHFDYKGPVGCGFPSVIKKGVCKSKGNLHKSWKGLNVEDLFEEATGLDFTVINDADAAGYAMMNYGIGKGMQGLVVMITIGTGLGSGAFLDGRLIPNFELGQIPYGDYDKIESWAAASAKEKGDLSFKKWGKRFNKFLELVELIVAPDTIVLGGGTSKDFDEFRKWIKIDTPVIPAGLQNHAGIIGAATACLVCHPELNEG